MRAIQTFLPHPRHEEVQRIFVNADPLTAWQAARHFDGAKIPWVRLFFDVRDIPDLIRGKKPDANDRRIGVDQVAENGIGFKILHETEGKEVVVGAIGQFWHLNIPFADVKPEGFEKFNENGWGKLAWAIAVDPYRDGSTISFELRTSATDDASWERLNRYYHIIGIPSQLIRHSVLSHLQAELGKMKFPDDDKVIFPGNEIIPEARHQITFHKNIEAPVAMVWRYIMQLGCDRAGWYSIDWLDHGGQPSIDHLVPGWETRKVGDQLAATPMMNSFYDVYSIFTEKYFIIGGETERMGGPFKMTWAFILEAIGDDATHLISNARMTASPKWSEWLMGNVLYPPIHGLMSAVQLRNIKGLAERDAQSRTKFNMKGITVL